MLNVFGVVKLVFLICLVLVLILFIGKYLLMILVEVIVICLDGIWSCWVIYVCVCCVLFMFCWLV